MHLRAQWDTCGAGAPSSPAPVPATLSASNLHLLRGSERELARRRSDKWEQETLAGRSPHLQEMAGFPAAPPPAGPEGSYVAGELASLPSAVRKARASFRREDRLAAATLRDIISP